MHYVCMHFGLIHDDELNGHKDVVYRTITLFSKGKRPIHFISKAPHVHITACICLNNCGS